MRKTWRQGAARVWDFASRANRVRGRGLHPVLIWTLLLGVGQILASEAMPGVTVPKVGEHRLRILAPDLLELVVINSKQPGAARVTMWDWVDGQGNFVEPDLSSVRVRVDGEVRAVASVGFKRRPVYAPRGNWDLRIGNALYLKLGSGIAAGQNVQVSNDGTLWPTNFSFQTTADPLRHSPAIHVNQEGYLPSFPKQAIVGYYLGSLGELAMPGTAFSVVDAQHGAVVLEGTLTLRQDIGYTYSPTPYQKVYAADFSGLTTAGVYRVVVPGMGGSLPFRIGEEVGMSFARTYALGVFHQRSGYDVRMPFTRYTHAPDHMAPARVPVDASAPFVFTWTTVSNYARELNSANPPQIAPQLNGPGAQLYPFVNPGPVDVSGGHFEAANYSKVTWNSAQIIHVLVFAADSLPGVGALDNLGLPESGDGISDALQEAKWEADCLVKLQDADGGFYYMVHPQEREYEIDVLPEHGDPQVVWPKNTATTASAVAALAQCASSPRFKQAYPEAAAQYLAKALLGWQFLTNALAMHGEAGAYQKLMHFDDAFTHTDDLAWAACELFRATGDLQFRARLENWLPDPTAPSTARWGWLRMYACYGNAIRSYATAASSGRLQGEQLDATYLGKCITAITNCGNDTMHWSWYNAYGSSFPPETKAARGAGWYYSAEQAFDLAVAHLFNPSGAYVDAILQNLNYEAGCNPVDRSYVTGLGWNRQREVVDQYSDNDHRIMPKIGVPIGNIQNGFVWTWTYGSEPGTHCSPPDGAEVAPYPFYDRWCDFWNVTTEASTPNTVRCLATALWLAAQTPQAAQSWRSTSATILVSPGGHAPGLPITLNLQTEEPNLNGVRILWEARGQEPFFGGISYSFTPSQEGPHWAEAEVQWPDGRRAFAITSVNVVAAGAPYLSAPQWQNSELSFVLNGVPGASYAILASTNLSTWNAVSTNTLPGSGSLRISAPVSTGNPQGFYRVLRLP